MFHLSGHLTFFSGPILLFQLAVEEAFWDLSEFLPGVASGGTSRSRRCLGCSSAGFDRLLREVVVHVVDQEVGAETAAATDHVERLCEKP